ncbi:hypothetical protein HQN59_06965 [Schlegelella sp. ID0723]|uniref:Uncharacterized protein n=1 Tax=Piscinibacter koreensis TaxID=2742824 RepID=A0A7Y6NLW0_9BURK|nr:hypothetical protein [Schlegelella koreensis]
MRNLEESAAFKPVLVIKYSDEGLAQGQFQTFVDDLGWFMAAALRIELKQDESFVVLARRYAEEPEGLLTLSMDVTRATEMGFEPVRAAKALSHIFSPTEIVWIADDSDLRVELGPFALGRRFPLTQEDAVPDSKDAQFPRGRVA